MSAGWLLHAPLICMLAQSAFALALLSGSASIALAEPVSCSIAAGEDELAICMSKELRIMDGELDRTYRAARERWTASMSNSVKVMHEEWIKERRKCGADQVCLMARMVEQITALDNMRPGSPSWILKKTSPSKRARDGNSRRARHEPDRFAGRWPQARWPRRAGDAGRAPPSYEAPYHRQAGGRQRDSPPFSVQARFRD